MSNSPMRTAFIAEMKQWFPDQATRPSLAASNAMGDFYVSGVQNRWLFFKAGWVACKESIVHQSVGQDLGVAIDKTLGIDRYTPGA